MSFLQFFVNVGAVLLPFFIVWAFSDVRYEKSLLKKQCEYEKVVAATAARVRLEVLLADKPKQPELWWGDECITISEDGERVIHINERPIGTSISDLVAQTLSGQSGQIGALKELTTWIGKIAANEDNIPKLLAEEKVDPLCNWGHTRKNPMDFEVAIMPTKWNEG